MRIFIFSLLLLLSLPILAQKTHYIKLKTTPLVLPNRNFFIAKVIDNRLNKDNIGMVQKGLVNDKYPADFAKPLADYLAEKVQEMLPFSEGQVSIYLQVNALYITERTTFSAETGTASIDVDFINPKDSLSYGNFTAEVSNKGVEVTGGHDRRILEGLTKCLTNFNATNWQGVERTEAVVQEGWNFSQVPPRALFSSFKNLKRNQPMERGVFDIRSNSNKKFPYYKVYKEGSRKQIKDVSIISNGTHLYLHVSNYHVGNYFIKSQLLGRYIYFEDRFHNQAAAIAFGALGGAASTKHYSIVLDTETGEVKVLRKEEMRNLLVDYPDLMAKYEEGKHKPAAIKLLIEELNQQLAKKS